MDLDPETIEEIRAILRRDCVVEVTVAFYDNSDDALEPTDIGATAEFEAKTPAREMKADLGEMLDSLRDLLARIVEP